MLNIKLGPQKHVNDPAGKDVYRRSLEKNGALYVLPLGCAGWGVMRYHRIEIERDVMGTDVTLHFITDDRNTAIEFAVNFPTEELK